VDQQPAVTTPAGSGTGSVSSAEPVPGPGSPRPGSVSGTEPWHPLTAGEVLELLETSPQGLSPEEATRRLGQYLTENRMTVQQTWAGERTCTPAEVRTDSDAHHRPTAADPAALALLAGVLTNEATVALLLAPVATGFVPDLVRDARPVATETPFDFPPTQLVLRVEPLDLAAWWRIALVATVILIGVEIEKAIRRWADHRITEVSS
jgi:hypothetical protein